MPGTGIVCRQPVTCGRCDHGHRHQARAAVRRVQCSIRKDIRRDSARPAQPRNSHALGSGQNQEKQSSAEQDRFRLSAASPASDASGGDLPPINHDTKAVGEGDDEHENSSAQDIDSILAKVPQH